MFCNKCGNQMPDTAKFCPKCGNRVAPRADVRTNVVTNPAPANQELKTSFYGNSVQNPGPSGNPIQNRQTPLREQPIKISGPTQTQPAREPVQPAWSGAQTPAAPDPVSPPVSRPVWPNQPEPAAEEKPVEIYEPVPVNRAEKKEKPQLVLGPKPSAGKRVVAVFLCIFIFLFGLIGSLLGAARMAYSEKSIDRMMEKIMDGYDEDANEDELVGVGELTLPSGDALWKVMYDAASENMDLNDQYGISKSEFRTIMGEPFTADIFGNRLKDIFGYLLGSRDFPETFLRDIANEIEENEGTKRKPGRIAEIANRDDTKYVFAEDDLGGFDHLFNESELKEKLGVGDAKKFTELDLRNMITENPEEGKDSFWHDIDVLGVIKSLFSLWMLILVCGVVVALLVLLFVLLRSYLRSAFTRSGVTLISLGALVALCGGGIYAAANRILLSTLLAALLNPLAISLLIIGGGTLVIGLIFAVIIRPLCRKRDAVADGEAELPMEEPAL